MAASQRNRRLLLELVVIATVMFGFGYLLPPLYATLCRFVGVKRVVPEAATPLAARPDMSRTVLMQFDSNVRDGLPWSFRPTQATATVHPGELTRTLYEVRNESDERIVGQAIPSYAPAGAASYVHKVQCFCFTAQTLAPREVKAMPVVFVIDPELPRDVQTLTLSYTFFNATAASSSEGQ